SNQLMNESTIPRWRVELRAFAELFALAGLALAQPLLDIFGKSPQHFIFRGIERGDIIVFALLITFAVPVILAIIGTLLGLVSQQVRTVYHSVVLGMLAA